MDNKITEYDLRFMRRKTGFRASEIDNNQEVKCQMRYFLCLERKPDLLKSRENELHNTPKLNIGPSAAIECL